MRILDMPDNLARSSWSDDEIAGPMGYRHSVLFDCARDAMVAYHDITRTPVGLPENICPELVSYVMAHGHEVVFEPISQLTGLAKSAVHLYGYQAWQKGASLSLDPLMTGWVRSLKTESAIISFGHKKMLSIGYGGAFLTDDQGLAGEMAERGHWNSYYSHFLIEAIKGFYDHIQARWETVGLWDKYLGDDLSRISQEQLMPWRVMRRQPAGRRERDGIVSYLRGAGIAVGTNYPPIGGHNEWGDTVLNFFCPPKAEKLEIQRACDVIKKALYG